MTRRSILQAAAALGLHPPGKNDDFARRIFSRINEIRTLSGAATLHWSDPLADCAVQQSLRKAELRFPGHEDPQRGGLAQRLAAARIAYTLSGENIFMERGWDDPVNYAVVFWWYSPGHQANMLNPEYSDTGVGLSQGQDGAWFVTQIFCAPPNPRTRARR